ncbi:Cysteine-rich repeat secretory protein 11 [Spatholobus suberectus]|nr:Cysteine-rich repeat secretory protein 11 [Spatholobus suberectus]
MDVSHSTILFTLTFLLFVFLPSSKPVSDYSTLVYKTCASQTFNDQLSQTYSQTLNSLFQQLIAQSSQHKFFKTTEAVSDDTAISGLFQCRDDIGKEDCFSCVNLLPQMSNTLCSDSISARVQLDRCYIHYETEELPETTPGESKSSNLLHKDCGEPVVDYYIQFKELMDEAFVTLESGILNSNGYYTTNYKSVKLMAQCEGDSDTCDCSNCVSDAVQVAKEECGTSLSAQIYLDNCFISYGIPGNSVPGASRNSNAKKLAAILVGGAAALFLGFIFLSLLNSRFRKGDYE